MKENLYECSSSKAFRVIHHHSRIQTVCTLESYRIKISQHLYFCYYFIFLIELLFLLREGNENPPCYPQRKILTQYIPHILLDK
jgi:hypothetical protein